MREVNFSIPNVNKASVGITTALYDRRALDCTSTLPLINSLNHLAYLTTSSARIRDILTIDGGIERLVCILKQGRSQEMMEMWKWNLAFQCVVNIGVRGSEGVRTRVVEADMVPVIATILYNYIQVVDKSREKADAENSGRRRTLQSTQNVQCSSNSRLRLNGMSRQTFQHRDHTENRPSLRRHDPPPAIEIPPSLPTPIFERQAVEHSGELTTAERTPALLSTTSPTERTPSARQYHHHHHHHNQQQHHHHHHHHHRHRSQDSRITSPHGSRHMPMQSLPAAIGSSLDAGDGLFVRPIRDVERLPTMIPSLQTGITSQPESPTTPSAPSIQAVLQPQDDRGTAARQHSTSGDSDEGNADEEIGELSGHIDDRGEPMVDIQTTVNIQGPEDRDTILEDVSVAPTIPNVSEAQEPETFNITHQSANDGSIINPSVTPTNNDIGFPPPAQSVAVVNMTSQPVTQNSHTHYLLDRSAPPGVLAAMPRDEDVLMSLQLLAYVSKYCNLRTYFQKTHLVPQLKIRDNLGISEERHAVTCSTEDQAINDEDSEVEDEKEEYLLPDDFNIFPLVEKFTVRHHSQDMQHWAGVVMRNLCRKDDARGGIRQCAYYECGRWERSARQFAKCRRCRRTKYCSKECQKNAWVFHRHWCQVASP